jgi:hypothetical protein
MTQHLLIAGADVAAALAGRYSSTRGMDAESV